jgi:hypothetical protein
MEVLHQILSKNFQMMTIMFDSFISLFLPEFQTCANVILVNLVIVIHRLLNHISQTCRVKIENSFETHSFLITYGFENVSGK